MPLPATILPAVTDAVLGHLATHFLGATGGDVPSARAAARSMLAAYDPQTEEELHLATDIVSFGFHALAALGEAAQPDLAINRVIRLRGSAVSLSREAHKARRRLHQLQHTRPPEAPQPEQQPPRPAAEATAPAPEPIPTAPTAAPATGLIDFARDALHPVPRPGDIRNLTQRRAAERITENLRRNQAEQLRRDAVAAGPTPPAPALDQALRA